MNNLKTFKGRRILQQFVLSLSILFVSVTGAKGQVFDILAQPSGMDTLQLPPGYKYDNTFRFSAIVSGADQSAMEWLKNSLGLDYTYSYGGPSHRQLAYLRDSNRWGTEWAKCRVCDSMEFSRWRNQSALGIPMVFSPGYMSHSVPDAQALEMFYQNYIGDSAQWYTPLQVSYHDTALRRGCERLNKRPDSLMHQPTVYIGAGRFNACDTCLEDRAIARNGTWTNEVLQTRSSDSIYYRLGYQDSTKWFDLSFAIRVDEEPILPDSVPSTTVLGYAITWRRDTIGQTLGTDGDREACHCAFYVPLDTFYITKGMYLNAPDFIRRQNIPNEADYREFFHPFRFPNDTMMRSSLGDTLALIPLDTTVIVNGLSYSSIPVYGRCIQKDSAGNCVEWGTESYHPQQAPFGGGAEAKDSNTWRRLYCNRLRDTLLARGVYPGFDSAGMQTIPFNNDFVWEFRTTNLVRVDFLMGRISAHLFRIIQRGDLDSFLIADVQGILNDTAMGDLMLKIAMPDEPNDVRYPGTALVASIAQRAILDRDSSDTRGTFVNPKAFAERYRLHTGDVDSTGVKIVQTLANQVYPLSPQLPIFYANPDLMSWEATRDYYKMQRRDTVVNGKLIRPRYIMGTNPNDYLFYTQTSQGFAKEVVKRHVTDVTVARKYYRHLGAIPYPNTSVVQVHGWVGSSTVYNEETGLYNGFAYGRPVTPEEITVQGWLALNTGIDGGLHFSDFLYCGEEFGIANGRQIDTVSEYDTLSPWQDPRFTQFKHKLPKMWLGFGSRSNAVKRVIAEFRQKILPVYTRLDLYNGAHFSLNLKPDSIPVPLFDMIRAERAVRENFSANVGSGVYDPPDSTFLEVTIYRPSLYDTVPYRAHAQYAIVTNRRMWPLDTIRYADSTLALLDSLAIFDTLSVDDYDTLGLGRIDFRRPVIVLKNNTDVLADSAVIEKVGYEGEWNARLAYGDTLALDWLEPGWGAMYRVTPVTQGIGEYGTAYNNAVRSENPSTPSAARDRIVVYERDSVIYARAVDSVGAWSREVMISDPDDTVIVSSSRVARNFFPALAVSRGGFGLTRFVWERDSAGLRSVQTAQLLQGTPLTRLGLDTLNPASDVFRHQLSAASPLTGPPAMTPAIVSVVDAKTGFGGFIIGWAAQDSGITLMALREFLAVNGELGPKESTMLSDVYSTESAGVNLICQYPTLANVPTYDRFNVNPGRVSGTAADIDSISDLAIAIPADWQFYNLAHLAYQQGAGGNRQLGERIYYHRIGANFPNYESPHPDASPGLWVDVAEHVTKNIPACGFYHPSIAADSVRVGVAFEVFEANNEQINIGLRFRDSSGVNNSTGQPLKEWETNLYRWGGPLKEKFGWIFVASEYVRPSLTEFPLMDSTTLDLQAEGGLSWFWQDAPDGRAHPQYLYRYGWFEPRDIGEGKDPTMTLVPLLESNPFEATSIFHRSDDSSRVVSENLEGNDVWRFPARLLNTPGNPLPQLFAGIPATGGIIAHAQLAGNTPYCDVQFPMKFQWGLAFGHETVDHPDDDRHVPGDPPSPNNTPGLPPTFFNGAKEGKTVVDGLTNAENVVRTGLFTKGGGPVKVRRIVAAGDSIANVLNGMPWDFVRSAPANIYNVVEVVRASDSVVVWRSDTITARGLDTLDAYVNEELEIPSYLLGSPGTVLWCRMRTFTSAGISYDVSGGFTFYREDSTSLALPKRSSPWQIEGQTGNEAGESILRVQIIPNPAKDRAEVRVTVQNPGTVTVSVWSLLGEHLATLPAIEAETRGIYTVAVDLSNVKPGIYLVKAETNGTIATSRIHVE
ncbi:MAG: T9SS type A sorting domain-containing protein [Candidatus Kapaibacterium sp.]|nr:T9SS type A sorting domain-containing protein [Ignavibacteria bacterium]